MKKGVNEGYANVSDTFNSYETMVFHVAKLEFNLNLVELKHRGFMTYFVLQIKTSGVVVKTILFSRLFLDCYNLNLDTNFGLNILMSCVS